MPSYIPEHYFGAVYDGNGHWTGQYGLVPWPEHLKPRELLPSGVELTKKGEAYAEAALAEAKGVFFVTLDRYDRTSIATTIERLIDMLDALDDDPDMEDTADDEDGADDEPSLGWTASGPQAIEKNAPQDDREDDGDDLEPSLGGPGHYTDAGMMYDLEEDRCDDEPDGSDEPSLGWPEKESQCDAQPSDYWACDDDGSHNAEPRFDGEGYQIGNALLQKAGKAGVRVSPALATVGPDRLTIITPGLARIGEK